MLDNNDNNSENDDLEKIIVNYDDIQDPPPSYDLIIPYSGPIIKEFPKLKITIANGLNSSETFQEEVNNKKNLMTSFSKTFNYNNSMEITNIPLKTEVKLVTSMNEYDEEDKNKILLQEKYTETNKDINNLLEFYKNINSFIVTLLNNFEYIHSNHNLNFTNKKNRIEELLTSDVIEFKSNLSQLKKIKFQFQYLEKLKLEIYEFLKSRYELFYHYMKDFYDIAIENFSKKNKHINNK